MLADGLSAGVALLWPRAAQQLDEPIASAPMYTESFRAWEHGWTRYYERLRIPLELRPVSIHRYSAPVNATIMYARGSLLAGIFIAIPVVALVTVVRPPLARMGWPGSRESLEGSRH